MTASDKFPFGEERRLFYVAITRAKIKTYILYNTHFPSIFVTEFLFPEKISESGILRNPNAKKRWSKSQDQLVLKLHSEGKSITYIANKMGRSNASISMRLKKLMVK